MVLLCFTVLSCSGRNPETADSLTPEETISTETDSTVTASAQTSPAETVSAEASERPSGSGEGSSSSENEEVSTASDIPTEADSSSEAATSAEPETASDGTSSETPGPDIPICPPLPYLEGLEIPEWTGTPYTALNGNFPFFETSDLKPESYEIYYALDDLGRCTLADAVVGRDLQPTEKRGDISLIRPTGWHTDKYSFVNGQNLYNRCHLIAYYLTAENANERNLVTGTRYMNEDGMNSFENLVGDYVKETGNHVRYRVTPVFTGENLICDGLIVEGWSIEDEGDDICFCVFCYNLQPGVHIDYLTGDNYAENGEETLPSQTSAADFPTTEEDIIGDYVLNKNSHRFHLPSCDGAVSMSKKNREEYSGSRNALILDGYKPCPRCNP
ncbi:MAG: DNA/RNA non-specific endonuclease [Lachnospiraceae bacterium]|nr:DNA/RNA non-specific endonuclease [Lachnospiraceae bacterium]